MKIIHLDRELVLDAIKNVQRVQYLKGYYDKFPEYDLGHTLYKMRSKFARMVRVFTISSDNLRIYNHNKQIQNLLEIQKLAMDVHNLIEILIEWETRVDNRKTKHTRNTRAFNKQYKNPSGKTDMTPIKNNNRLRTGLSWTVSIPRDVLNQSRKRENEKVPRGLRDSITSGKDTVRYKRLEGVGFDTDFY
ncbi:unnamed protein product [Euphydryas editha]|nr:unnamed protein product [Euphydryas editha]